MSGFDEFMKKVDKAFQRRDRQSASSGCSQPRRDGVNLEKAKERVRRRVAQLAR